MKKYQDSPVNMLAAEAAKTFGGVHAPWGRDGEYFETDATVAIAAGPGDDPLPAYTLNLTMRSWGAGAGTLTASIYPADRDNDVSSRDLDFPSAKMDSKRSAAAIMADIGRRVVNDPRAAVALREYAKRLAALRARRVSVKDHIAGLLAACPNVRVSEMLPPSAIEARFFNKDGVHFEARVTNDGDVSFMRLGPMSNDQARRVLAILGEG